ncbi:hypothetical protein H5085_09650 [Pseudoalteromonas sp. SR43-6]|jgi:hypothetical protein|uniref:Uncharacterized protein n=3 Tax=Pseudoalteromonas TaxID=53246 RepID=F3BJY4_9GAMM|nr:MULTISPECIES: hypothetical protein [Pseudoalteromonas]ATC88916.1 hypothetical protein PARC_b0753 [Pseudoalteromonas arctica A 37-1-2]EGI73052.1 hypothetical protein PH505_ay00110 [Pseudoalteromonas distincta]KHM46742.1 hypothetical protein PL71_14550 [Pseudoalteromonas elyakovii]KID39403.1 hypothetical protein QT16_07655 [Pseudoalteromonas distincta]MBA6407960.1 hypothetical protein [Pseudoalteromonas sp. 5Ae-yellow]|tara:strand:- start:1557 stop:1793 length:237 start_codon:yes stop_codon:yes gene_type:complete
MDIMIPYLGRITRLEVESKSAFHIAGVQSGSAAEKVELENKKRRELQKKKKLNMLDDQNSKKKSNVDDDENPHLDTWA